MISIELLIDARYINNILAKNKRDVVRGKLLIMDQT